MTMSDQNNPQSDDPLKNPNRSSSTSPTQTQTSQIDQSPSQTQSQPQTYPPKPSDQDITPAEKLPPPPPTLLNDKSDEPHTPPEPPPSPQLPTDSKNLQTQSPEQKPAKETLEENSSDSPFDKPFKFASFSQRIFAVILDFAIISSITSGLYLTFSLFNLPVINQTQATSVGSSNIVVLAIASLALYLAILIYPTVFTGLFGGTIGKIILGLKIVNSAGQKLKISQVIIRTLIGYTLELLTLFFGFFWVLFDRKKQALEDKLAASYVICNQPAKKMDRRRSLYYQPRFVWRILVRHLSTTKSKNLTDHQCQRIPKSQN